MKTDNVVLRFICEQEGALEALPGFVVGRHHVPKFAGSRVTEFIRTVGDQFLQDESSTLFQRMRQVYGLKRRDVQTSQDPGSVSLRTDQLHVHVALQGHPAHIDQYVQRTTIVPQTSTDAQGEQFERFVGASW